MWLPPRRYWLPAQPLTTSRGTHGATRGTLHTWTEDGVTGHGDAPDAVTLRDNSRHAARVTAWAQELARHHADAQLAGCTLGVWLHQRFAPDLAPPPPLQLQATCDLQMLTRWQPDDPRVVALKVKLTGTESTDTLRALLSPWRHLTLRVDVNGGWLGRADLAELLAMAADLGVAYVEDPVPLHALPLRSPVPMAVDALDSTPDEAVAAVLDGRAQVLVVKPPLWGSVAALRSDLARVVAAGVPWVLSSSLDGPVGLWQLRQLRMMLPEATQPAGIATDALWTPEDRARAALDGAEAVLPEAVPLVTIERSFSQSTLQRRIEDTRVHLHRAGVRPGDRVVTWARNSPGVFAVQAAVRTLGATWVPLHPRWTMGEVRAVLPRIVPKLVVVDNAMPDGPETAQITLAAVTRPAQGDALTAAKIDWTAEAEIAAILFTSGSSGPPKGVLLSRRALDAAASSALTQLGPMPGAMWLCALPLCHVSGLVLLERARKMDLTVGLLDQPDTRALTEALQTWQPELVSLVPAQLTRLLDEQVRPWPQLRAVLVGGAPCPPEVVDAALGAGWPVLPTYGMTETAAQVVTAPLGPLPQPWPRGEPGVCVGVPLPGTEVRVEAGEILVRSPQLLDGYLDDAVATTAALRDGWLHTGDLGHVDARGWLWVQGRRGDMILRGGENIAPDRVEAALAAIPEVLDVCVVGVPDRVLGQRVAAWVVVAHPIAPETLAQALVHLAPFQRPEIWLQTSDPLPRTGPGKVARAAVRARLTGDA